MLSDGFAYNNPGSITILKKERTDQNHCFNLTMFTRRNRGCGQSIFVALILLTMVCGGYLYYDLRNSLDETRNRALRYKEQQDSLTGQLQVVYEHRLRLEKALQESKSDSKKIKEESQRNLEFTKQEAGNHYNALNIQHKMLKSQHDDLKEELDTLKQDHRRVIQDKEEQGLDNEKKIGHLNDTFRIDRNKMMNELNNLQVEANKGKQYQLQMYQAKQDLDKVVLEKSQLSQRVLDLEQQDSIHQGENNFLQTQVDGYNKQLQALKLQLEQQQQQAAKPKSPVQVPVQNPNVMAANNIDPYEQQKAAFDRQRQQDLLQQRYQQQPNVYQAVNKEIDPRLVQQPQLPNREQVFVQPGNAQQAPISNNQQQQVIQQQQEIQQQQIQPQQIQPIQQQQIQQQQIQQQDAIMAAKFNQQNNVQLQPQLDGNVQNGDPVNVKLNVNLPVKVNNLDEMDNNEESDYDKARAEERKKEKGGMRKQVRGQEESNVAEKEIDDIAKPLKLIEEDIEASDARNEEPQMKQGDGINKKQPLWEKQREEEDRKMAREYREKEDAKEADNFEADKDVNGAVDNDFGPDSQFQRDEGEDAQLEGLVVDVHPDEVQEQIEAQEGLRKQQAAQLLARVRQAHQEDGDGDEDSKADREDKRSDDQSDPDAGRGRKIDENYNDANDQNVFNKPDVENDNRVVAQPPAIDDMEENNGINNAPVLEVPVEGPVGALDEEEGDSDKQRNKYKREMR